MTISRHSYFSTRARILSCAALVSLLAFGCPDTETNPAPPPPACEAAPTAQEWCGGGDENCNGLTDEPNAADCTVFMADPDGDGLGNTLDVKCLCAAEPPYTTTTPDPCSLPDACDNGDPCTEGLCDSQTGACEYIAREDGIACEDGDFCTENDSCAAGVCVAGAERDCDDGDQCTADNCTPGIGCVPVESLGPCDDGDECTDNDMCDEEGQCLGEVLVNCGKPYCGDGICDSDESCADCAADCSPLGAGECAGECDPLGEPSCDDNFVCVPVNTDGTAFDGAFAEGNGVCAASCETDEDCADGACLKTLDTDAAGICAAAGEACEPGASPTVCWGTDDNACVALADGAGACVAGCFVQDPDACGGLTPCLPREDAAWHVGLCAGSSAACDPVTQDGCGEFATCIVAGGEAINGYAFICDEQVGEPQLGEPCDATGLCGPGLACSENRCTTYCDPTSVLCESGEECFDLAGNFGLPAGVLGTCEPACGDGACSDDEGCATCAADCGECGLLCGDDYCHDEEGCDGCPEDCGECSTCGDGDCVGGEGCESCPEDCGACVCGDEICTPGENCDTCEGDCGMCICGDGTCDSTENCESCPDDCTTCQCGDELCSPGETCLSCAADCGECGTCEDTFCDADENCETCPADCGGCECGDGTCDSAENCDSCNEDCPCVCGDGYCSESTESCFDCEADCGDCGVCGDGECLGFELCSSCPQDCGACEVACGDDLCVDGETCSSCEADCGECTVCGNGECEVGETCSSCAADCQFSGLPCGETCDPTVVPTTCAANQACASTPDLEVFTEGLFELGNGACAKPCTADEDCAAGACEKIAGLTGSGICTAGVAACDPAAPDCDAGESCEAIDGQAGKGVCLAGCIMADPTGCTAAGTTCTARSAEKWHQGVCVGGQPACDVLTQSGCDQPATCVVLGGAPYSGQVNFCDPEVGPVPETGTCTAADCEAGLVCIDDKCHSYCNPSAPACGAGICEDVGQSVFLPPGHLGYCE